MGCSRACAQDEGLSDFCELTHDDTLLSLRFAKNRQLSMLKDHIPRLLTKIPRLVWRKTLLTLERLCSALCQYVRAVSSFLLKGTFAAQHGVRIAMLPCADGRLFIAHGCRSKLSNWQRESSIVASEAYTCVGGRATP